MLQDKIENILQSYLQALQIYGNLSVTDYLAIRETAKQELNTGYAERVGTNTHVSNPAMNEQQKSISMYSNTSYYQIPAPTQRVPVTVQPQIAQPDYAQLTLPQPTMTPEQALRQMQDQFN